MIVFSVGKPSELKSLYQWSIANLLKSLTDWDILYVRKFSKFQLCFENHVFYRDNMPSLKNQQICQIECVSNDNISREEFFLLLLWGVFEEKKTKIHSSRRKKSWIKL